MLSAESPGQQHGAESPHPSFQYGFPPPPPAGAAVPPSAATTADAAAAAAAVFSGGSGGTAAGGHPVSTSPADLIYDSINMSQVQNYSPSLSTSLGEPFLFTLSCRITNSE